MVHHHRSYHQQPRKDDEEQQQQQQQQQQQDSQHLCDYYCGGGCKQKAKPSFLRLLFIFSLVSCGLVFALLILGFSSSSSPLPSFWYESDSAVHGNGINNSSSSSSSSSSRVPCSFVPNNTICCDRTSSFRTDVCVMRGDVRTRSSSSSIFLYSSSSPSLPLAVASSGRKESRSNSSAPGGASVVEKIRPYTRKWETSVMDTIDELDLVLKRREADDDRNHTCDVVHDVPAVVFSTGGYTGNVYHEFNDGILPLYITSHHLNREVVFVVLEYHSWWITKYGDILSQLSAYPPVDFAGDNRTHCFPEVTVGLRIHDELTVDASLMSADKTVLDFRHLLDDAYMPRIRSIEREEEEQERAKAEEANSLAPLAAAAAAAEPSLEMVGERPPKLVIVSRNGSRGIENEKELVKLCEEIGFEVEVLRPDRTTELAKIYRVLNSSDAMIGVHGAAMTHFLFMKPGSVFIQIVPLGTDWAAQTYYGDPAAKMGLKYVGYRILPRESSLFGQYDMDDPVLRDPKSVTAKGWQVTKKVYLDGQNVRLDLNRFFKRLTRAYQYTVSKKRMDWNWNWSENWQRKQKKLQQQQEARR